MQRIADRISAQAVTFNMHLEADAAVGTERGTKEAEREVKAPRAAQLKRAFCGPRLLATVLAPRRRVGDRAVDVATYPFAGYTPSPKQRRRQLI